jgi:phosphoribosylaminoimidazolecarboxamide formyltransferase/IMP cyclohydrolase
VNDKMAKTALISVTDKNDLESIAGALAEQGYSILSSSGTMKYLSDKGIEVEEIAAYTESQELLGGRVKTLHPKIHAGLLADRDDSDHMKQLEEQSIRPIDVVIVNLYPFMEKQRAGGLSEREMCEYIDIGGITLIRAAAKNFQHVTIVTSPNDYESVVDELATNGHTTMETRRRLARDAFSLTSQYDAAINSFFRENTPKERTPQNLSVSLDKVEDLRYGENPHQYAALYRTREDSAILALEKLQGKDLSYNNYLDLIGAFALARDLGENCVAVIKHTNPCGAAWCGDTLTSYRRALATDRVSSFGGIVAVNGAVEKELAEELNQLFLEVVLARSISGDARALLAKKKNVRVLTLQDSYWESPYQGNYSLLAEGILLMQNTDAGFPELNELQVVTKRTPSDDELQACKMAWKVAKHVKSNAIVIADQEGTVGVGAGQMSRVDSSQIATRKAFDADFSLIGKSAASDAFFPFPDGVTTLAQAGITAVIQPGGSMRDKEVIAAADEANVTMIFTGRRHFRHT